MKFLKLFCLVIIFCTSCNKNTDEIEVIKNVQNNERRDAVNLEKPTGSHEKGNTEQLIYMTSFLIGKTLLENEEARDYFYKEIASSKIEKIALINMLGDNIIDSNPFAISFHEQYNMYNFRAPAPPIKSAEPDPLRWGGVLNLNYEQYLFEIVKLKKREIYFPNKSSWLDDKQGLREYFEESNTVVCLWNNDSAILFSDGVIIHGDGRGEYLPLNFDASKSPHFMFVLRDIIN